MLGCKQNHEVSHVFRGIFLFFRIRFFVLFIEKRFFDRSLLDLILQSKKQKAVKAGMLTYDEVGASVTGIQVESTVVSPLEVTVVGPGSQRTRSQSARSQSKR